MADITLRKSHLLHSEIGLKSSQIGMKCIIKWCRPLRYDVQWDHLEEASDLYLTYLTYSSCPMEEHRAATKLLHRTRFGAVLFSWVHVIPDTPISVSVLLLQVCLGLPTLLLPCGFQSRAWRRRVMFEDGFLGVWPIHPNCLFRISMSTWFCPVLLWRSLFDFFLDPPPGSQLRSWYNRNIINMYFEIKFSLYMLQANHIQ